MRMQDDEEDKVKRGGPAGPRRRQRGKAAV